MIAEQRQFITQEAYLSMERVALEKSEYYQGETLPMAGASKQYNRIKENVSGEIYIALRGSDCQSFSSDMRVHLPETTLFAYPDIVIVCGEPQLIDDEFDNLLNPVVLIEVLLDGTEDYDRGRKFQRYRKIPSLQEYILINSQAVEIEVWRKNELGLWTLIEQVSESTGSFTIGTISLTISLLKVYDRTIGLLA
ncbi:Uma2 family endonuclease [Spirosoma sp. KCTC 42546]|uniref:Uma2 family endonuclease n=1 Tax=Spirosoma sp. KCTC 42546 TaxID=2520506 RepID=UPI00115C0BCF|nr:Uma2 family endonuclease [Spirosoma sp. KCTC 42546]QDK83101.1 Uma2 family endonuclease [Spirosoma sp. KCTC 42546]